MDTLFRGIFDTEAASAPAITDFIICLLAALVLGLIMAAAYTVKSRYTASFAVALALLPAAVCAVIMTVNGNIGAGVAVAGAFSLVRFRSAQGTAREIAAIFLAMGTGLLTGMGYIAFAVLFTLVMCAALILYSCLGFGARKQANRKLLKITVPEELDYTGAFDGIFEEYTLENELISVKTHNMGSMFRLTYSIKLKSADCEKEFIDRLRTRNGNLEIVLSKQENSTEL